LPRRINETVRATQATAADTTLWRTEYFRTSERFWLNLQVRYDLEVQKDRLGDRLRRGVTVRDQA
jgi:plasmid maintenance system antidote protein VapI